MKGVPTTDTHQRAVVGDLCTLHSHPEGAVITDKRDSEEETMGRELQRSQVEKDESVAL